MLTTVLFAETPGVRVGTGQRVETTIHLEMRTTRRAARCPQCRQRSRRVHARYGRTLRDLAWCGPQVVLHLQVRRFVCTRCPRRTFTARLPTLVAPHARRTVRLTTQRERTGFARGGAPGARRRALWCAGGPSCVWCGRLPCPRSGRCGWSASMTGVRHDVAVRSS